MKRRIATVLATAVAAFPVPAPAIDTQTDVGVFTAIVAGSHVGAGNPVPVSGVVPGAALEFTQRVDRFRVHLEGIPTVGASTGVTGPYGRSSASLSLLNATALVDVAPRGLLRVGGGFQLVNLSNTNGSNGDVNQSRITSAIYAAGSTIPLAHGRFLEANLLVDPNLRGDLHVFNYLGVARPDKPEAGAEVDYALAYGWRGRRLSYLAGVRGLSYHTRNTRLGELVDRNVGAGVTFEARYAFGGER